MGTLRQPFLQFAVISCAISPTLALAESGWLVCPIPEKYDNYSPRPKGLEPLAVYIEADSALFEEKGVSQMQGKVHISQHNKQLQADNATYDAATNTVTGTGNVQFDSGTMQIKGQDLQFNLKNETGEFNQATYHFSANEGRGSSQRIEQTSPTHTRMEQASYTACPVEKPDWSLNAKQIDLDRTQQRGVARGVNLKIRQTPVLYFPYFSFPLTDARQSGFLFPQFGTTDKSGLQIGTPYYFNLAPNYDMTVIPTLLSRRGIQLTTENRYLTTKNRGAIGLNLLPHDRVSNKNNRYYYNINHLTTLTPRSSVTIKAAGVSDDQYFADLGNSLAATSVVNLERRAEYLKRGQDWSFSGAIQNYQVLDGGTAPHARTPQLTFKYAPKRKRNGVQLTSEVEYTNFTGKKDATNGQRLDSYTKISKTFKNRTGSAYIKPALSARHTEYVLDDANNTKLHRTVPTASVDAGLIFERNIKQGKLVQTLEPRAFYTHTPYRDQNAIPVFDSSERSLGFNQLFSENRFTGRDRIGDSNQLTLAVTSRIQNPKTGKELLRGSVGQVVHFQDRKVTLPNSTTQTAKRSEFVVEAAGALNKRTQLTTTTYWDSNKATFTAGEARVRYKDDKQRIFNVGYAERKGDFKAAHASFTVPVKKGWKAVGAVEQDLLNKRNLETVLGAEYESCCWKTRIATRNYVLPDNQTRDNAVFIEVELKGLGNFGNQTRDLLQNRIYGYE